jgi:hypothetical protein
MSFLNALNWIHLQCCLLQNEFPRLTSSQSFAIVTSFLWIKPSVPSVDHLRIPLQGHIYLRCGNIYKSPLRPKLVEWGSDTRQCVALLHGFSGCVVLYMLHDSVEKVTFINTIPYRLVLSFITMLWWAVKIGSLTLLMKWLAADLVLIFIVWDHQALEKSCIRICGCETMCRSVGKNRKVFSTTPVSWYSVHPDNRDCLFLHSPQHGVIMQDIRNHMKNLFVVGHLILILHNPSWSVIEMVTL